MEERHMTDEIRMTGEQFSRELEYQAALYFVKQMRRRGMISGADYREWRRILIGECDPPIGRIDNPAVPSPTAGTAPASSRSAERVPEPLK